MKKVNRPDYVTCSTHGKRGYHSKKEAERAARMFHPGHHLSAYACDTGTGLWHLGHLPKQVIRKRIPRGYLTQKRSDQRE